jgi:hypothetical protein
MMNTKMRSQAIAFSVILFVVIFCIEEIDARGRGGGGFSRSGIAAGGGMSGRSSQRQASQRQRQNVGSERSDNQTVRADQRQTGADTRQDNRGDSAEDRQDRRDGNREDKQSAIKDRQEDRQDFIDDEHDDNWDRHHYDGDGDGDFLAGAIVGGAIVGTAAAVSTSTTYVTVLPCTASVVVVQGVSYYNCASTWYQRGYAGSQVTYITVGPPPGY